MDPYSNFQPDDPKGIRRMGLKDSAFVEIIRIESPSSIFVRPVDHIRDQLVFTEPYALTQISDFSPGNFALAPIEERVFGRCVILKNLERLECCRVFFIDDAATAMVSYKCLFKIEESQMLHPWQVMHVSIGKLTCLNDSWEPSQCSKFAEIVGEFPNFQITACQVDLESSPGRPAILVNLYGFHSQKELNSKISIAEICQVLMEDVVLSENFLFSDFESEKLENLDSERDDHEIILLEEFRRGLPNDWIQEINQNWKDEEGDWDIETNRVLEWNSDLLKKYFYEIHGEKCVLMFVEPKSCFSPVEMHVTPIFGPSEETDNEQWIFDQFDMTAEFLGVIDDFYSNIKNQKPLDLEEIKLALSKGRTYAIAAVHHRKRAGPMWLRCEILEPLPNSNLSIRLIDQGQIIFQKVKNLHRIHRSHTRIPPVTLKIGWRPQFSDELDEESCEEHWKTPMVAEAWRQIVPYDVPVVVGPDFEFHESGKLQFTKIRLMDEDVNLLDELALPSPISTEKTAEIPFDEDDEEDSEDSEDSEGVFNADDDEEEDNYDNFYDYCSD